MLTPFYIYICFNNLYNTITSLGITMFCVVISMTFSFCPVPRLPDPPFYCLTSTTCPRLPNVYYLPQTALSGLRDVKGQG